MGLLCDLKTWRKGDFVIFYQMMRGESPLKRGFRDVFKIISDPFYDTSTVTYGKNHVFGKCPVCGYPYSEELDKQSWTKWCSNPTKRHTLQEDQNILPYRVLISPVHRFEKPVDDNTAYVDAEDYGELPTLRWRKVTGAGRARSAQRILPEEGEKLLRLMKRINNNRKLTNSSTKNYLTPEQASRKQVAATLNILRETSGAPLFAVKNNGCFETETGLETWMLENIDKGIPILNEVVGPLDELEFFGNNVQYGVGGENADILLLHKKNGARFKTTVFELKKGDVDQDTVNQVLSPEQQNYAKWIGQLVTANCNPPTNSLIIQPVLVGFEVTADAIHQIKKIHADFGTFTKKITIDYTQSRKRQAVRVKVLKPVLISYKVNNGTVEFTEKKYRL
jgi:hypothetical protein